MKGRYAVVVIVVRGLGAFPLDMLRVDSCVPSTGPDVGHMMRDGQLEPREISLRRFYSVGGSRDPSFNRWAVYGWNVTKVG